jgi:hypothetical protein
MTITVTLLIEEMLTEEKWPLCIKLTTVTRHHKSMFFTNKTLHILEFIGL